jgi:plasmid maintenance system antidote protein VapI
MTISELLDLCRGTMNRKQFAATLNTTPATVTRIYQGKRGLGARTVAALLVRYPEHKDTILEVFMARGETL